MTCCWFDDEDDDISTPCCARGREVQIKVKPGLLRRLWMRIFPNHPTVWLIVYDQNGKAEYVMYQGDTMNVNDSRSIRLTQDQWRIHIDYRNLNQIHIHVRTDEYLWALLKKEQEALQEV